MDFQVVWFEGNYQDYEADRHKRLDTDPDQPHRIRYKPPAVALARRFAGDAARDLPGLHVPGNSDLPHRLRRPHICAMVLPLVAPRRRLLSGYSSAA